MNPIYPAWRCPQCGYESFSGYFASHTVCPICPDRPDMAYAAPDEMFRDVGERLQRDSEYMNSESRQAVRGWVRSWRSMTRDVFDRFARRL